MEHLKRVSDGDWTKHLTPGDTRLLLDHFSTSTTFLQLLPYLEAGAKAGCWLSTAGVRATALRGENWANERGVLTPDGRLMNGFRDDTVPISRPRRFRRVLQPDDKPAIEPAAIAPKRRGGYIKDAHGQRRMATTWVVEGQPVDPRELTRVPFHPNEVMGERPRSALTVWLLPQLEAFAPARTVYPKLSALLPRRAPVKHTCADLDSAREARRAKGQVAAGEDKQTKTSICPIPREDSRTCLRPHPPLRPSYP